MECYTAAKNNNVMTYAGKWIELEKNILSKITQIKKYKYYMYSIVPKY